MNSWHYSVENSSYLKTLDLLSCIFVEIYFHKCVVPLSKNSANQVGSEKDIFSGVFEFGSAYLGTDVTSTCGIYFSHS